MRDQGLYRICAWPARHGIAAFAGHSRITTCTNLPAARPSDAIKAGQTLQADGEEAAVYANLQVGVVKLVKMLADGRQQIVGLQFPPDFIGRPFGRQSQLSAEAVSDVEVCTFPRSVLEDMIKRHPELERQLFQQTLRELDEARDWLLANGRKSARARVASLLHMIATHVPAVSLLHAHSRRSVIFDLPLTRAASSSASACVFTALAPASTSLSGRKS